MCRSLRQIALEIMSDWENPSPNAIPYILAMKQLTSILDMYYQDTAKSVVLYFLSNAGSWKGEVARRVKTELREMVK